MHCGVVHTSKNKQTSGEHICCIGLTGAGHIHLFMHVSECGSVCITSNTRSKRSVLSIDYTECNETTHAIQLKFENNRNNFWVICRFFSCHDSYGIQFGLALLGF